MKERDEGPVCVCVCVCVCVFEFVFVRHCLCVSLCFILFFVCVGNLLDKQEGKQ